MAGGAGPKVAVLKGGRSAEREVSLSSGQECAAALREAGFEVTEIDAGADLCARLIEAAPDVVFNALHGRWGEDGAVQGLLEWLRLPYTHSGIYASALAMDKERSKAVFRAEGLPVVESILAPRRGGRGAPHDGAALRGQAHNEGSSVGVYLVTERANGPPTLAPAMPATVMVEAYVPGRELTVAVLGDRPLAVTDILTDGWYDYAAKYQTGGSRHVCPAEMPEDVFDACLDIALTALPGARLPRAQPGPISAGTTGAGLGGLVLLETNTQPGMTPTSLAPEQAAAAGMSFPDLCRWLVEDASCDR